MYHRPLTLRAVEETRDGTTALRACRWRRVVQNMLETDVVFGLERVHRGVKLKWCIVERCSPPREKQRLEHVGHQAHNEDQTRTVHGPLFIS